MSDDKFTKRLAKLETQLALLRNISVLHAINDWAAANQLPLFFYADEGIEFNKEYRIDAESIGWEFSFKRFPGFPVFWVEHLDSGKSACFGLVDGIEQPRPRGRLVE